MPDIDPYETLGVARNASAKEVKTAYRRRSRELHPDRNAAPEANRAMSALNEAYGLLADADRRSEYDRVHPVKLQPRPREFPPESGACALQPESMPDWYEFLDLRMGAGTAHVLEALTRTGAAIRAANYSDEDYGRLRVQLKTAADTLTNPSLRAIYDRALEGTPPPPGAYPNWHEDWYSYIGVRPHAPFVRIAEQVADLASKSRKGTREYRELELAWRTLRDEGSRAIYDEELARRREAESRA